MNNNMPAITTEKHICDVCKRDCAEIDLSNNADYEGTICQSCYNDGECMNCNEYYGPKNVAEYNTLRFGKTYLCKDCGETWGGLTENLPHYSNIAKIDTVSTGGDVIVDYLTMKGGKVLAIGIDSVTLYGSEDKAYNEPEDDLQKFIIKG